MSKDTKVEVDQDVDEMEVLPNPKTKRLDEPYNEQENEGNFLAAALHEMLEESKISFKQQTLRAEKQWPELYRLRRENEAL